MVFSVGFRLDLALDLGPVGYVPRLYLIAVTTKKSIYYPLTLHSIIFPPHIFFIKVHIIFFRNIKEDYLIFLLTGFKLIHFVAEMIGCQCVQILWFGSQWFLLL